MKQALCVVASLALACLLIRAARVRVAGGFVDPLSRTTAQDEALYANSAINLDFQGGWITPAFMGRFALEKPPLLPWIAGLSTRMAGVSRLALRFPVALLCSLAVGLVFLWVSELRSWQAGACAAALLASSRLWHVLGAMCVADGLLAALFIAAMYCLFSDPWLDSKWAFYGFSAALAGAILAKGAAGLLPLAALGVYCLVAPLKYKPSFVRICLAVALAIAVAAPWFLYQAVAHSRWFPAEIVGAESAPYATRGNPVPFYAMRLFFLDPLLIAAALAALPAFLSDIRRERSPGAALVASWLGVALASLLLWPNRDARYLLPLLPALAILACAYGPLTQMKPAAWVLGVAAAAVLWKAIVPGAPWGISFAGPPSQPIVETLSSYCEMNRAGELIVVGMDDGLYASVLPLAHLRYAIERIKPDYATGTLLSFQSPAELGEIVRTHPGSDFLAPESFRTQISPDPAHTFLHTAGDHILLLSREAKARSQPPAWSCGL